MMLAKGSEKRRKSHCVVATELKFGKMKNTLEMDGGTNSCTTI
jgi:hypothetical protein